MISWKFLNNTFLSSTKLSSRKCQQIAHHTLINLKRLESTEPFGTLYNDLLPAYNTFYDLYIRRMGQKGSIKSKTGELKKLFAQLRGPMISEWDVSIQMQYPRRTPEYVSILPYGRKPFQAGAQDNRIDAVGRLAKALEPYAALANVRTEVIAFHTTLQENKKSQNGSKGAKKITANELNAAREAVCDELYGILGALMWHYKKTPHLVAPFFDLTAIKQKHQKSYTHNLKPAETREVLTHTFEAEEQVRLINKGDTLLQFSLCRLPHSPVVQPIVSIPAHSEKTVPIESLGDITHRFLKVKNMGETEGGRYRIVIE